MAAFHHAHSADEVHVPVCPKCHTQCPACPTEPYSPRPTGARRYTDDRYLPRHPHLRRLQVEDW